MESVTLVRTFKGISKAIEEAFQNFDFPNLNSQSPVVIKPNLCGIKGPETGATTDPQVIEALINYLKSHYDSQEIFIVESDATALNVDMAFQLLGYNKLANKLGIKTVNLSKLPYTKRKLSQSLNLTEVKIPKLLENPHFLISVAKMKTHTMCKFTATLKNMYGCNPEPYKAKYHKELDKNIVDFAKVFKPHLSIIDATVAMEGSGPIAGVPIKLDTLIFGKDPLATDHLTARIMGINPEKVEYLRLAKEQQLGTTKYKLTGVDIETLKLKFKAEPLSAAIFSKVSPMFKVIRRLR